MAETEELQQISMWFSEEGLSPDASSEAQLCFLWRSFQRTTSHLSAVSKDLEAHRSQHSAELAEVRKSLEQIRIFTEQKKELAQEIQDENDELREQLQLFMSHQDAQMSEVAKMLYNEGLTELIPSSPSEQLAYLLVERASLLGKSEDPDKLTVDGKPSNSVEAEALRVCQSNHKRAPHHLQNKWKKIFGFQKGPQSKHIISEENRPLTGQDSSLEKECCRLERDLEEGSRRLAMAHNEIRRLTDQLESAHFTQRLYEPELESAQKEVEQLRYEVEKLKKYEMVELRKAKELNDRLDLEIRTLRNRVRSLDAEKRSLQQTVASLQGELRRDENSLQDQEDTEMLEIERLEPAKCGRIFTRDKPTGPTQQLMDKEKTPVDKGNLALILAKICSKESHLQHQRHLQEKRQVSHPDKSVMIQEDTTSKTENKEVQTDLCQENAQSKVCPNCQVECETLKKEICETLQCLDKQRSKYHTAREKHKERLRLAKQVFDDETKWRDERIKSLEHDLSLCSHSLAKEREFVLCISLQNEKLLVEKRELLEELTEEEHKKNTKLTAALSKSRVDFLEMENKEMGHRIAHPSNHLERSLQTSQPLHPTGSGCKQQEWALLFIMIYVDHS
ncbi:coiled-coil domain-containing protein 30-like isoform X2 [Oryzias latipes]|uniref:coiled-coil domain-containing protein 30-like isoform X2 n=1 Tax=Oryzias latipes TaxID=8090 RepID=UPI000CE23BD6|nr:coiled-coil domain-containing protein 30-like isoform X2 [Oryzias latipes]